MGVAARLAGQGVAFALVTVVRAVAPTSGKPGDKAILTDDGRWLGWVGGSCAEPAARRAAAAALVDGQCRLLHVTNDAEIAERAGVEVAKMACYSGGSLEIYVEPHLAPPRLIVLGRSPIADALCALGLTLRYRVTHVDLRNEGEPSPSPELSPGVEQARSLAELPGSLGSNAFVVVASHGHFESEALEWALAGRAGYVGLVASRRRVPDVLSRLADRGHDLSRVRAPAGLVIGAARPEEVALSVLSEIVAARRTGVARVEALAGIPLAPSVSATQNAPVGSHSNAQPSCCDPSDSAPPARVERAVASCCDVEAEPASAASAAPARVAPARQLRFSALVLAAGLSRRMGAPNKLLLPVEGQPLVVRAVEAVRGASPSELVVVLGHQAAEVGRVLSPLGLKTVHNPDYESGQVSSVRAGLAALSEPVDAVMVCLGDQPLLTSADLRKLMAAFAARPKGSILVPMCGPLRGNPVVLDWKSVEETLSRGTNFGCRHFLDENSDRVYFWQSESDHFIRDVDQPADYQALVAQTRS